MATISERDYERVLSLVARLHACDDLETFSRAVVTELARLIGADQTTFNYLALTVPKVVTVADFEPPNHHEQQRTFSRYMGGHPVLQHYLRTGDGSAHLISDFQSEREYHALPLYREFYHHIGYEDQLTCMLFPPGSEMIGLALGRGRRSFTERDRRVLELLRPHIAQAYRRVEQLVLYRRALRGGVPAAAPGDLRVTAVSLDSAGRVIRFGARAQRWFRAFFPGRPRNPTGLPDAVADWLQRSRQNRRVRRDAASPARDVLVREQGGQWLRLRRFPAVAGGGGILVLELEVLRAAAQRACAGVLTPREVEVLLEVERGRTNDEIAVALGISPLTVRTHLEHIFEKLQVHTRTAAVARFRERCGGIR